MKIDEAIKILTLFTEPESEADIQDLDNAIKLGIEALKRCSERSNRFPNIPHLRLPGETK